MKFCRPFLLACLLLGSHSILLAESYTLHSFQKIQLSDEFYGEGAAFGDFNNDGVQDIVSGPFWYQGPEFTDRREIYEPKVFNPLEYSDSFLVFTRDFDLDGWTDVFVVGFPGEAAGWYRNPQGKSGHWARHDVYSFVGNESPALADITGDGIPELICNNETHLGYARFNQNDPTAAWTFVPVSPAGKWHRFTHGLGHGDVNGDGRSDLITENGWWEQPESLAGNPEWPMHPVAFGPGSQMFAYDLNDNGAADVITSLHAHGWGLAWYDQTATEAGGIAFEKKIILGERHEDNRYGVRFSQLHAVALADIDADGLQDIVTGKRFWAHGAHGDSEPNAPAVLYWFKTVRDPNGGVAFLPFLIDDDSGVGTQVVAGDLTGDGFPDVVVGNKKGTFVFLNTPARVSREAWEKAQPRVIMAHRVTAKP